MKGKKTADNESLRAFFFDPAAIIQMVYGSTDDGIPIIAEFRDIADEWLRIIHEYSILSDDSYDGSLPDEYLEYARKEADDFARAMLEGKEKPSFIILPPDNELPILMEADGENVSTFTYMICDFSLRLHNALRKRSFEKHIHVIIVPLMANMLENLEIEHDDGKVDSMLSILALFLMHRKAEDFLQEYGNFPGKLTVLPIDIWDSKETKWEKNDYSSHNGVFTVHRSSEFLAVTESDDLRLIHRYPDFMYEEDECLTDEDIEYIDELAEDILSDYGENDILVMEGEMVDDNGSDNMESEHMKYVSGYLLHSLILKAVEEGKHVVLAAFRNLDAYFDHVIPMYEAEGITCPECGKGHLGIDRKKGIICPICKERLATTDEIIASGLTSVVKDFVSQFPILPGSITEI